MIQNKKGMSAVIVTLLLVMLSIALVGIVYVVVNNVVGDSTSQVASSAKCLNSQIQIVAATYNMTDTNASVSIKRLAGNDEIAGVRLIFYNDQGSSVTFDTANDITTLQTNSYSQINTTLANVTKIEAAILFADDSGNNNPCTGVVEFDQINTVA